MHHVPARSSPGLEENFQSIFLSFCKGLMMVVILVSSSIVVADLLHVLMISHFAWWARHGHTFKGYRLGDRL
jgi:hypothetical protein